MNFSIINYSFTVFELLYIAEYVDMRSHGKILLFKIPKSIAMNDMNILTDYATRLPDVIFHNMLLLVENFYNLLLKIKCC